MPRCIAAMLTLIATLLASADAAADPAGDSAAARVLRLTGGVHAKLAWVRGCSPHGEDGVLLYGETGGHQLITLDTRLGTERTFQPGPGSFANPLITRDGAQVIWSDVERQTSWIADWSDPAKKRKLGEKDCWFILCTRWDAETGQEWAYAYDGASVWATAVLVDEDKRDELGSKKVYRFPLAKGPAAKELVWSKTRIGSYFTVSSDGKKAASVFPWPKVGIADLPDLRWENRNPGDEWGCYACIAPDDSYRFFFFEGSHRRLHMFDPGQTASRTIDVTGIPGNQGKHDSAFPRFSNDARYLCIATPLGYEEQASGDVHLGRFDAGFTKIEAWAQVSTHRHRDVALSAWLESGVVAGARPAKAKKP